MLNTRAPGSPRIRRRIREDTTSSSSSSKEDGPNLQQRAESTTERMMDPQP